ncbi:hypothetical protein Scep_025267 [Stephania cephalantha]|uniref:Glutaredoxin domain-containing protein n=1 Tax=Stephania cephalantha TaxID=152367 RepID=A0AAP0ENI7_9MAGN
MGCVSSALLDQADELTQFDGSTGLGHHIVSLTSTTYGLLTLDPPTLQTDRKPPTPPRFNRTAPEPEIINSWELMAGLDSDSSRFTPPPKPTSTSPSSLLHTVLELDSRISRTPKVSTPGPNRPVCKENLNPNRPVRTGSEVTGECKSGVLRSFGDHPGRPSLTATTIEESPFPRRCPKGGENRVVLYTTTLRGVRKTYEECNAVRSVFEGIGVSISERDVSMHSGYREELKELLKSSSSSSCSAINGGLVPRVFVKGRYIGGAEEVLRIHEEGNLGKLVEGVPRKKCGVVCEGCGGVGFLPCFDCNGSCKVVVVVSTVKEMQGRDVVKRCPCCNENGLVLCPLCS